MAHIHSVHDSDTQFTINPITRQIKNDSLTKTTLMQGDHNSETFTFGLPRHIEGHDMSLCNKVEVHYFNIDSKTKEVRSGVYTAEDFRIDPEDESMVVFSWCVSGNSTKFTGLLKFRISYKCEEEKIITYSWNTAFFTGISIGEGEDAAEIFATEYVDIIEQWKESVVLGFEDDLQSVAEELKADIAEWKEQNRIEGFHLWTGTNEEYEAQKYSMKPRTFCVVTDEPAPADYIVYRDEHTVKYNSGKARSTFSVTFVSVPINSEFNGFYGSTPAKLPFPEDVVKHIAKKPRICNVNLAGAYMNSDETDVISVALFHYGVHTETKTQGVALLSSRSCDSASVCFNVELEYDWK